MSLCLLLPLEAAVAARNFASCEHLPDCTIVARPSSRARSSALQLPQRCPSFFLSASHALHSGMTALSLLAYYASCPSVVSSTAAPFLLLHGAAPSSACLA